MKISALIPLALLAASTTALADDMANPWYVVGEVTHSKTKLDTATSDAALGGASSTLTKNHGNQWRLQLGYKFNPYFALEGGYIDFGKTEFTSTGGSTAHGTVKAGGIDVAALGILPITENFSVFGKAGLVAAKVKSSLDVTPPGDTKSNVVAPLVGLGVSYKLSDNLDLRAEYDHVSKLGKSGTTDKLSSNMLSAGIAYYF